ncbi:hepatic lectin-like [Anabas testudineus]|uniref:hepatic lectin-like n=1 Tax=Anabas testudineus TaxID=64144 RepID=UPI000E45E633|nr:hepatic lectin-like [Anabas testudineus]XP_033182138.1 hepatic lectin-like [Anabas testudineus]
MSRSQSYREGEAPDRRSKVTSERVALLVLSALLAAALIVIYRLSFENVHTKKSLQTLKDEHEALRKNLTVDTCPKCEEGWELHGGKCYYSSTRESTWNQSRDYCRRKGGDLVKIDSREEQFFLELRVRKKMDNDEDRFWIGLTDSKEEGKWLWVDDSPLNTSLTFWIDTQPDNWPGDSPEGEDCVRMGKEKRRS